MPRPNLLAYILMSRASIDESNQFNDSQGDRVAAFRKWVDRKQELKLGYLVARQIRTEVDRVKRENENLKRENESLRHVKEFWTETLKCRDYELELSHKHELQRVNERKLAQIEHILPQDFMFQLRHTVETLGRTKNEIQNTMDRINDIKNNGKDNQ